MTQYRLYFGRLAGAGEWPVSRITDSEFEQFLADSVDPRFDAYTVFSASGRWNGQAEPSTVVEVIANEFQVYPDAAKSVRLIAAEYCARFNQDAVLVTSVELATSELVEREVKAA